MLINYLHPEAHSCYFISLLTFGSALSIQSLAKFNG